MDKKLIFNPKYPEFREEHEFDRDVHFSNFYNEHFEVKQFKKEIQTFFNNYEYKETGKSELFELQSQQKFVPLYANFNTYKTPKRQGSLLVYHSLGSGKTCTSIVAGEVYREHLKRQFKNHRNKFFKNKKKIIYVAPKSVQESLKEKIGGKILKKKENGNIIFYNKKSNCIESVIFEEIKREVGQIPLLERDQIEQAKNIEKTREDIIKKTRDKNIQKNWEIIGPMKFSNMLKFKDDELSDTAKQLFDGDNLIIIDEVQNIISQEGVYYERISKILNYFSRNNIVILMSATPLYDKPIELGLTLNLLNPRVYFPFEEEAFNDIFYKRIDSNASRNEGKIRKVSNIGLFKWMTTGYVSYFSGGDPKKFPKKRLIDINHKMEGNQYEAYKSELKERIKNIKLNNTDKDDDSKLLLSNLIKPRQMSNIGIRNIKKGKNLSPFDIYENSSKISWIINRVVPPELNTFNSGINEYSPGKVLIFSDMLSYGVDAIATLLEYLGFKQVDDNEDLTTDDNRFIVWKGDSDTQKTRKYVNAFNAKNNLKGSKIKIIIGSLTIREGVSFTNIKDVHILEPWWNESRIDQIIARSIRFQSHFDSEEKDKYVNVFRHQSVLSTFPDVDEDIKDMKGAITTLGLHKFSVDTYIRTIAENKRHTRRIFEKILKECSVDCDLNKRGHNVRLVEHLAQQSNGNYFLFYENPTTGHLSTYIDGETNINRDNFNEYLQSYNQIIKDELTDVKIIYDENDNKKFGNDINMKLLNKYTEESEIDNEGILNENIECDKEVILTNIEKEKRKELINTTRKMQEVSILFRELYSRKNRNNFQLNKKTLFNVLLGIKNYKQCLTEEEKKSLIKYLKTSKIGVTQSDMDENTKQLYDNFVNNKSYNFLINFKNKDNKIINLLAYICKYPDAKLDLFYESHSDKYFLEGKRITQSEYNLVKSVIGISKLRKIDKEIGNKIPDPGLENETKTEEVKKIYKKPRVRIRNVKAQNNLFFEREDYDEK